MVLWAIALLVLIAIPAEIFLLNRILTPITEIKGHIDQILVDGVILTGHLDGVTEMLAETKDIVSQVATGALRYGGGVDKVKCGPGDDRAVTDAAEAAALLPDLLEDGDTVLVKASRGVGLEVVAEALTAARA